MSSIRPHTVIEDIIREDWGRILSSVTYRTGDLQLAEDCLQDAIETALKIWTDDGLPQSPAGWLVTTARRKAIDRMRRDKAFASKTDELKFLEQMRELPDREEVISSIKDKRLELIFTCCHPSLTEKTKVALTLRTIGGLTTDEIANAFLDESKTLSQRLVRARKKIKLAGIPYEVPTKDLLSDRLNGVLRVIYLIFNEGYAASMGREFMRIDLVNEAIRLARILSGLMPDETEVSGLLALILLHDSRRYARISQDGQIIALKKQNRRKWDKVKIKEGTRLLKQTLKCKRVGPYQIQAAISAIHAEAVSWDQTDWPHIAALYKLLYDVQPSPIVRVNQAMAVSYAESVEAGFAVLERIGNEKALAHYKPYYLVKADLLERANRYAEAKAQLDIALTLSENNAETEFLKTKIETL